MITSLQESSSQPLAWIFFLETVQFHNRSVWWNPWRSDCPASLAYQRSCRCGTGLRTGCRYLYRVLRNENLFT